MDLFYVSFKVGDDGPQILKKTVSFSPSGNVFGENGLIFDHGFWTKDSLTHSLGKSTCPYFPTREDAEKRAKWDYPNWIVCSPIHLEAYRLILLFGGWEFGRGETEKTMERKYGISSFVLWDLIRGSFRLNWIFLKPTILDFLSRGPIEIRDPSGKTRKHRTPKGMLECLLSYQKQGILPNIQPRKEMVK